MNNKDSKNNAHNDENDFGYLTAVAGLTLAATLIIVMFATSGQV